MDIARARADTPGCTEVVHFNNAGAALMPQAVIDAQIGHLQLEARIGGYEAAEAAGDRVEACYDSIARLLNCSREEIALVENATVGWCLAFYAVDLQPGDRILTTEAEYSSNYINYLKVARDKGAIIDVVPSDASGQLDIEALEGMIDGKVKLIAITHVPTNGGLVNPAAEVGRVARANGILYLLDACQSPGQITLDVEAIGCDFLSATGRKYLRGPRGSGFLYVRKDLLKTIEPPMLDNHAAVWTARDQFELRGDARRFENWEFNYAAVLGLGASVDYALSWGIDAIEQRVVSLAGNLRSALVEIPGVTTTDIGASKCGIVTFTKDGMEAPELRAALRAQNINVSNSTIKSTRIDMERRGLSDILRASVHYYNTDEEIERLCAAVAAL
ncbi:aminotransferase class V-fold PLP-dependent enzyme [Pelagibius sp. Alg239-R121]|uniref:aminotransferase class V-fold PLP-dependent enzyme n=1 Tax=Pelagibius sp. Alg239-R121 TaxID=2993448 RepID=UPI0024A72001|nr:aminotransferase class V-fold PLP-dependent enzyme [Pelagibius sp. Alg239-R121]